MRWFQLRKVRTENFSPDEGLLNPWEKMAGRLPGGVGAEAVDSCERQQTCGPMEFLPFASRSCQAYARSTRRSLAATPIISLLCIHFFHLVQAGLGNGPSL